MDNEEQKSTQTNTPICPKCGAAMHRAGTVFSGTKEAQNWRCRKGHRSMKPVWKNKETKSVGDDVGNADDSGDDAEAEVAEDRDGDGDGDSDGGDGDSSIGDDDGVEEAVDD